MYTIDQLERDISDILTDLSRARIDQLERDISEVITELSIIRIDRGRRYGKADDTLANVRKAKGWKGAYIHAIECMSRLDNFFDQPTPDREDFENAAGDLINYALYLLILYRQELDGLVGTGKGTVNGTEKQPNPDGAGHIPAFVKGKGII